MANRINYQKLLDERIERLIKEGDVPSLLLHSCCGPCSSYVLEYLSEYFLITVFYYNPNIYPPEEFNIRSKEQERFIKEFGEHAKNPIRFIEGKYESDRFYAISKGLENEPERGRRCHLCYRLRLFEAAKYAAEHGFRYVTTTLSISPLKDAQALNRIGEEAAKEYGIEYLYSDFKKKNGFKRSTELSAEYGMYRQDYCGCEFSYKARKAGSVQAEA